MNKTVSSNIGGWIFNLDEDAYVRLSTYLEALKTKLSQTKSGDEIVKDIELRIAELFREKNGNTKEVISITDVEETIALLGNPDDFIDEEASTNSFEETSRPRRAFFRDTENGSIAGVCAGLANYFGIDVFVVRLIAILLLIFGGFAIPAYIILWIAAPKAVTSADKLKMKGEPVTADNIKKEVMEATERIKKSKFVKEVGEKVENAFRSPSPFVRKIKQLFGIFTLLVVLFTGLFFALFVFGEYGYYINDGEEIYSFQQLSDLVFYDGMQKTLAWNAFILFFLCPLLLLFSWSMTLLIQRKNKWVRRVNTGLFFAWLFSIGLIVLVSLQIGRDFTHQIKIQQSIADTSLAHLNIQILEDPIAYKSEYNRKTGIAQDYIVTNTPSIKSNDIEVKIISSPDSLVHVNAFIKAYGKSDNRALVRAKNVQMNSHFEGNTFFISPYIEYPYGDKLRGQELSLIIAIPAQTSIKWIGNKELIDIDEDEDTIFDSGFVRIELKD